jgi:hypothetical protein
MEDWFVCEEAVSGFPVGEQEVNKERARKRPIVRCRVDFIKRLEKVMGLKNIKSIILLALNQ